MKPNCSYIVTMIEYSRTNSVPYNYSKVHNEMGIEWKMVYSMALLQLVSSRFLGKLPLHLPLNHFVVSLVDVSVSTWPWIGLCETNLRIHFVL